METHARHTNICTTTTPLRADTIRGRNIFYTAEPPAFEDEGKWRGSGEVNERPKARPLDCTAKDKPAQWMNKLTYDQSGHAVPADELVARGAKRHAHGDDKRVDKPPNNKRKEELG